MSYTKKPEKRKHEAPVQKAPAGLMLAAFMTMATLGLTVVFCITRAAASMKRIIFRKIDSGEGAFELICVSHVPWEGVWQRNQQTMSRLSGREKVVYVRPAYTIGIGGDLRILSYLFGRKKNENLLVINPVLLWGETRFRLIRAVNRAILISSVRFGALRAGFTGLPRVLWFYFPRWEYVCGGLDEQLVVYDIQDDYLTWTNAAEDIDLRERHLLEKADIVFTGTKSLFKKKRTSGREIHFIQNGVESDHFSRALRAETEVPEDVKRLPRPIIGYFGLLGDRIDVSLLGLLADRHPDWSIVLIGPVNKALCPVPEKKNIFLLGEKSYESLPGYLKGFDVSTIPYYMNETTMDLNPTKLLEYLAGGKPVVSTALNDVVELFSEYVYVARDQEAFLTLTEKAVENPDRDFTEKGIRFAKQFTWEAMVHRIRRRLLEKL